MKAVKVLILLSLSYHLIAESKASSSSCEIYLPSSSKRLEHVLESKGYRTNFIKGPKAQAPKGKLYGEIKVKYSPFYKRFKNRCLVRVIIKLNSTNKNQKNIDLSLKDEQVNRRLGDITNTVSCDKVLPRVINKIPKCSDL